jgi:hypothetical protein
MKQKYKPVDRLLTTDNTDGNFLGQKLCFLLFKRYVCIRGLKCPFAQPEQAVENEPVLAFTRESGRKLFVGLVFVIDVIVAHV